MEDKDKPGGSGKLAEVFTQTCALFEATSNTSYFALMVIDIWQQASEPADSSDSFFDEISIGAVLTLMAVTLVIFPVSWVANCWMYRNDTDEMLTPLMPTQQLPLDASALRYSEWMSKLVLGFLATLYAALSVWLTAYGLLLFFQPLVMNDWVLLVLLGGVGAISLVSQWSVSYACLSQAWRETQHFFSLPGLSPAQKQRFGVDMGCVLLVLACASVVLFKEVAEQINVGAAVLSILVYPLSELLFCYREAKFEVSKSAQANSEDGSVQSESPSFAYRFVRAGAAWSEFAVAGYGFFELVDMDFSPSFLGELLKGNSENVAEILLLMVGACVLGCASYRAGLLSTVRWNSSPATRWRGELAVQSCTTT